MDTKPSVKKKLSFKDFLGSLYCRYQDDEVSALGAQLTYYLILSFFPFLIFLLSLISFTHMTTDELLGTLTRVLPNLSYQTVTDVISGIMTGHDEKLLSFGIVAAVWSTANGVSAIMKAMNKAYDCEEDRPYWKVQGVALIFTLAMAVVILFSFIMLVFGKVIGEHIFTFIRLPYFETVWGIAKYLIPLVTLICLFLLMYKYLPNLHLKFREVLPGALFATFGWLVTSILFSFFYVNNFGNYTKTYGSIGGVIVLLIWLYISSIIIIMAAKSTPPFILRETA